MAYQHRAGIETPRGRGTQTQRLYRKWLTASADERKRIENSLTNICARACQGLCPPVEGGNDYNRNMDRRFSKRWGWCARFVESELYGKITEWNPDQQQFIREASTAMIDGCRYIARRCKQRLIDEIRKTNRMSQAEYLGRVERDERGRFLGA